MSLAEFTELEIAQELVRRIEAGEASALSDAPLGVDHPAWANVGRDGEHEGAFNDDPATGVAATLTLDGGSLVVALEGTSFAVPDAVASLPGLVAAIDELDYAAKHNAREVEEDQHTP